MLAACDPRDSSERFQSQGGSEAKAMRRSEGAEFGAGALIDAATGDVIIILFQATSIQIIICD